ncbi:uncharacterized mitochondrial protein AtMg00810-like [Humulus lupulus]|uniref:uncharacterized mitochondrial protein AtMg00810-like n=1 Tax=Humulus lupulus TaxID=3486 RepID=UPI002B4054C3|nr:uncharacterized mitochondrial protein AtMg00810-like [Humulus lupulus]
MIVYVDDIIITGNHTEEMNSIKEMMEKEFEVKDLGALKYFTGMEFARSKKGSPVDKGRYQQLVGKPIYLSNTRLDIALAVSLVSQYIHDQCQGHLNAVYRFMRKVEVSTDAGWVGSLDDRKSTSQYCTMVWGNVVKWRSKKQAVIARSSIEAEYRAMAHGVCEAI